MAKTPVHKLSPSVRHGVDAASAAIARLSDSPLCDRPKRQDAFVMSRGSISPEISKLQEMPFDKSLECASRRFLGLPYLFEPLGEISGVDSDPLFRFDALDCLTYTEESMALSFSADADEFLNALNEIRYRDGEIGFASRNHFVEGDWILQNEEAGFIGDITRFVGGQDTRQAFSTVDRVEWIRGRDDLTDEEKDRIIEDLNEIGISEKQDVMLDYIPIDSFFTFTAREIIPNEEMLSRLPEISVIVMLRREEDAGAASTIVAHMGLLIAPINPDGTRGEPVIRHSSNRDKVITDEPLTDYLLDQMPNREGVMVLEVIKPAARLP